MISPLTTVAAVAWILTPWLPVVDAGGSIPVAYCSSENTAQMSSNFSIYQSEGLCYNFCLDDYAFAVLQYQECWCSNYAPADTVSTGNCNTKCPGYQSDICGGDSLYGYLALEKDPSGTRGAASSTATSTEETSTKQTTTSKQVTSTSNGATTVVILSTVTPSSSADPSTSDTDSSSATESTTTTPPPPTSTSDDPTTTSSTTEAPSSSSTWTPTPVVSVETVTGQVRTVTYTPTSPPSSVGESTGDSKSSSGGGLSTGAAVGLAVGLIALVAIVGGLFYLWFRRKRKLEREQNGLGSPGRRESMATPLPSQSMSENSRYMLSTDGRQVVEGWDSDPAGNRRSRLMPVDPRLDPFAPLYQRGDATKSRESVNTLRDDHDYSRRVAAQPVLRATNPDN